MVLMGLAPVALDWEKVSRHLFRIILTLAMTWGGAWMRRIENKLDQLDTLANKVDNLDKKIDLKTSSRLSLIDLKIWSQQLQNANPKLSIPWPTHYTLPGEDGRPLESQITMGLTPKDEFN